MAKKQRNIRMEDETYDEFQDLATPVQIELGANSIELEDILRTLITFYKDHSPVYEAYLKFDALAKRPSLS